MVLPPRRLGTNGERQSSALSIIIQYNPCPKKVCQNIMGTQKRQTSDQQDQKKAFQKSDTELDSKGKQEVAGWRIRERTPQSRF